MFDETLVVQSAISAFNNAALVAPTFFWLGLLALPLMALAYFYGADFMHRIGWTKGTLPRNAAVMTVVITLLWLVSFGGNYDVLRDGRSVLPFCIAGVVFACSALVGAVSRGVALPQWRGMSWRHRAVFALCAMLVAFFIGMSGVHTWWGVLMQIAAFGCGLIFGRMMPRMDAPMPVCLGVVGTITALMLMQPEFFRFGQLGMLSALHLVALLAVGMGLVATVALSGVKSRGRIHRSAYVKLKWMFRFMAALAIVLFFLTESVPVFLGALMVLLMMFAISVWHAKSVPNGLAMQMFAITLGGFGLITCLPVISALGVMIWAAIPSDSNFWQDSRFLL